ncbi:hypothetical protein ACFLZB_04090, partial [Nanoarchaeota archaeon]
MKKYILLCLFILLTACTAQIQSQALDVPYFSQEGPSCIQAQMRMALKYYYPEKDYSQEMLDQMTERNGNQWTWFSQAIPVLIEEGLDTYYYSTTPYEELNPTFVNSYYGDDGPLINSVTNWGALQKSIEYIMETDRYQNKKLDWQEVEQAFQEGSVILMIIDYNVLINKDGPYMGHGITITNINETHVTFHNSNMNPNQVATKEQFIEAWDAPGSQ